MTLPLKTAMINKSPSLKIRTEKEQRMTREDDRVLRVMIGTWCCPLAPKYYIYTVASSAAIFIGTTAKTSLVDRNGY